MEKGRGINSAGKTPQTGEKKIVPHLETEMKKGVLGATIK